MPCRFGPAASLSHNRGHTLPATSISNSTRADSRNRENYRKLLPAVGDHSVQSSNRLVALDHLRGFVVALVVLHHAFLAYCRFGHLDHRYYLLSTSPVVMGSAGLVSIFWCC
jgi:uncharacterized membrane protein